MHAPMSETVQESERAMHITWSRRTRIAAAATARAGYPEAPWPNRTRTLYPYPKQARYTGTDSIEDAANFSCETPY